MQLECLFLINVMQNLLIILGLNIFLKQNLENCNKMK